MAQIGYIHSLEEPIGQNLIRRLRKERRMSQAEVARSVGLSRQSVNAIENGKCQPRLVVAYRLARLFGRPIEHVFQLEELDRLELEYCGPLDLVPARRERADAPHRAPSGQVNSGRHSMAGRWDDGPRTARPRSDQPPASKPTPRTD